MLFYIAFFLLFVLLWIFGKSAWVKWVGVLCLLAVATVWRLSSWQHPLSLCIDEAEWLSLATRLQDCSVPFQCFNGSTTGFLSIEMLNVFSLLGLKFTYLNLRVFGYLIFIIPTAIFIYLGIKKWFGNPVAQGVFPWLGMFMVFGFYDREFLAYNTEYPLMLLYAVIYYLYARWMHKEYNVHLEPVIIGLVLGLLPYIKLQSVPFIFAFYALIMVTGWRYKKWKTIIYSHIALSFATILFFVIFLAKGIWMDFYRMYIESNMYYVNHRISSYKYSDNEFIHRLRAFKGMHITTFMPLYLGLLPLILWGLRKTTARQNLRNQICWPCLWIFVCVCYSTYTTGNGFGHYNVLLIVPVIYLLGNVYSFINTENLKIKNILTIIGIVIPIIVYARRAEIFKYDKVVLLTETEKYIINKSSRNENILFMGWREALEAQLRAKRRLPVRNATYQYIGIGDSSLRKYYQKGFFHDMQENKPRYVLDMENVMEMPGLKPVKAFILGNYILDTIVEDNLIYKLKNNSTDVTNK
jgi:hypothetical protein